MLDALFGPSIRSIDTCPHPSVDHKQQDKVHGFLLKNTIHHAHLCDLRKKLTHRKRHESSPDSVLLQGAVGQHFDATNRQ